MKCCLVLSERTLAVSHVMAVHHNVCRAVVEFTEDQLRAYHIRNPMPVVDACDAMLAALCDEVVEAEVLPLVKVGVNVMAHRHKF